MAPVASRRNSEASMEAGEGTRSFWESFRNELFHQWLRESAERIERLRYGKQAGEFLRW
jgi:hypothetical protein